MHAEIIFVCLYTDSMQMRMISLQKETGGIYTSCIGQGVFLVES